MPEKRRKRRKSGKLLGFTHEGLPVAVTEDGKVVVGGGCFTFQEGEDGLEIIFNENACPVEVKDAFSRLVNRLIDKKKTQTIIKKILE